jgi:hypothetical protein
MTNATHMCIQSDIIVWFSRARAAAASASTPPWRYNVQCNDDTLPTSSTRCSCRQQQCQLQTLLHRCSVPGAVTKGTQLAGYESTKCSSVTGGAMHDMVYTERTVSTFVFIFHVMNQWLGCHCSALKHTRTCCDTALHAVCTKVPCPKCDARSWNSRRFEAVQHQLMRVCSLYITDAVPVQTDGAMLSQSKNETIRRYDKRKLLSVVR